MPRELLTRMVLLLDDLHRKTNVECAFGGAGSPWEFNLRDLLRWCHLAESATPPSRRSPSALYHCTQRPRKAAHKHAERKVLALSLVL